MLIDLLPKLRVEGGYGDWLHPVPIEPYNLEHSHRNVRPAWTTLLSLSKGQG